MYFKILILFGILAVSTSVCDERRAVSFVPEVADHILKTTKYCFKEYDNDPKIDALIRDGGYGEDEPFKKFVHCSYYKAGYADKDGHVFVDKVIKAFPKDANIDEVTKKCSEITGQDEVDTTYQFFKCFQLHAPIRIALK